MSKIAIISRPDQGVLIDVGGCATLQESTHHLISTLQISSEFWKGLDVDLSLGDLSLTTEEVLQILAIAAEVGIKPQQVFTTSALTAGALTVLKIPVGSGKPMSLPVGPHATDEPVAAEAAAVLSHPDVATRDSQGGTAAPEHPDLAGLPPAAGQDERESATAGDGTADSPVKPGPGILYLRQTLRSGQSVSHKGHLVIVGDVNPGAEVTADGDITVWGVLRGMAHAGISGDTTAEIRALRLEPIQLRIAHAIARAPDSPRKGRANGSVAETARIIDGTIRISANVPD